MLLKAKLNGFLKIKIKIFHLKSCMLVCSVLIENSVPTAKFSMNPELQIWKSKLKTASTNCALRNVNHFYSNNIIYVNIRS